MKVYIPFIFFLFIGCNSKDDIINASAVNSENEASHVLNDPEQYLKNMLLVNLDMDVKDFQLTTASNIVVNFYSLVSKSESKLIVFRFSAFDCSTCIKSVLDKFKLLNLSNSYQLILIGDYSDLYERNRFEKIVLKEIDFHFYNAPEGSIEIPAEMEPNPYFFTLNPEGRIESFLMVNKNNLNPVDEYLSQFLNLVFQ